MSNSNHVDSMRAVRFHEYGEAAEVLKLEDAPTPIPGPEQIRVKAMACGLNPADWALCRGLFAGDLPRGIGLEVSGTVDALGDGVSDVKIGDLVFGPAEFRTPSAGAADYAIVYSWAAVPSGLDLHEAAALPMAVETAYRSIDMLKVASGQTLLVHGAGTTVGYAAVQIGLLMGAKVFATAGETYAPALRNMGAQVTGYGEGMVERVFAMVGGSPEFVLDTAPPSGVLPDLIKIAGGDPLRVLTITDFQSAQELGTLGSSGDFPVLRYDVLGQFGQLAAEGKFSVPIARKFPLEQWREAMEISQSGKARGKLLLIP